MATLPVLVELCDGSEVSIEVGEEYTVRDIKKVIEEATGVSVENQNLVFEGLEMQDDESVMDIGLGFDAVIQLRVTARQQAVEELEGLGWGVGGDWLIEAAQKGDADAVRVQLQAEVCVNSKQSSRYRQHTALHAACRGGSHLVAELLIEAAADVNSEDYFKEVPLHDTARSGHSHLTRLLLARGANPNVLNLHHRTPLMEAVARNKVSVAHVLLDHGCDTTITDPKGFKASDLAATKEMFELFPNKF